MQRGLRLLRPLGSLGLASAVCVGGVVRCNERAAPEAALFAACREGHVQAVRKAIVEDEAMLHATTKFGHTPLVLAAWKGHAALVRWLLEYGADPNREDSFGVTALHKAVAFRHVEVLEALLACERTDVNARVGVPSAPPEFEAQSNRDSALHLAARTADKSSAQMLRMLLRAGASTRVRDKRGDTPLHAAVRGGNAGSSKRLLNAGADGDEKNDALETPRSLARKARERLVAYGVLTNPTSKEGVAAREVHRVCKALGV